ncbi:MAG: hypothetical protein FGM32_08415 [Candidatus Kapabacteria bacterium]|nr:hypothetical protein [Candidatus Kapabacteria bacterium]
MNSFQIVRAKRALVEMLRAGQSQRIPVAECCERLNAAGYRVNLDVLRVLVEGSANSPLAFDGEDVVLNSPQGL